MLDSTDIHAPVNRLPRRKPAAKLTGKAARQAAALRSLECWATRYVIAAVVLSACLNAAANVQLCGSTSFAGQLAAGVLGAVVPLFVWIAGKAAGYAHRAGRNRIAVAVGSAGVCLLVLSIYHCSHALAVLTGSNWFLALLLAVGIDYGLVAAETAAILAHEE